jgi:hypothetical protein
VSTQPVSLRLLPHPIHRSRRRQRSQSRHLTGAAHRSKRSILLADLTSHRERLILRYDLAVRRADVAEGRREALARRIRALDKAIMALQHFASEGNGHR